MEDKDLILVNNYQKSTIETQKLIIEIQREMFLHLTKNCEASGKIAVSLTDEKDALVQIMEGQKKRIKVLEQIVGN